MPFGGMQITPHYKQQLDPHFLAWYLTQFRSSRMGYVHWSAGWRWTNFTDYHLVVLQEQNGTVDVAHNAPLSEDLHAHTWCRNTDSFALCVASMEGGTAENLGPNCPTVAQMRQLVVEAAMACCNLRVPVANLMTHAEAGDNVDQGPHPPYPTPGCSGDAALSYGPLTHTGPHACERWDWWLWVDPETLQLKVCTHPCPAGWEYWPDWFRGQAILRIQQMTRAKWIAA